MTSRPIHPAQSPPESWSEPGDVSDDPRSAAQGRGGVHVAGVALIAQYDDVVVPSAPPVLPRLFLAPGLVGTAVLQGGWWPHSFDPIAELPGLILALCARYGSVRELRLPSTDWYRPFSQLAVGAGIVHLVWSTDLDPAHLIVTTGDRRTIGLLVVAPDTEPTAATRAMTIAADPVNIRPANDIVAAEPSIFRR